MPKVAYFVVVGFGPVERKDLTQHPDHVGLSVMGPSGSAETLHAAAQWDWSRIHYPPQ